MAQASAASCARLDDSFGPYAGSCRGGFDLTLLFEETIMTLLPLGFLLLVIPPRVWFLVKRGKKVVQANAWPTIKMSAWFAFGGLQLAALILWASPVASRTRTSLAAAVLSLLATVPSYVLSYLEHDRTVRPSSLLGAFLLITLLCDATRARTLWLRATQDVDYAIAQLFSVAVAVKAALLVLESFRKRRILRPEYQAYPPEATAGIFDRSFFWWLNSLIRLGFGRILDIDDLFLLDKHLQAPNLHERFRRAWGSAQQKSRSLLLTSFGVLKWIILGTVPSRVCLTVFNFAQPFLINRAILLSQQAISNETTQVGYGLIGAYVLVYVGIAVSTGLYQHRTYRTITMIRGGLVSMVYRKTGTLCLKDVDPATSMTVMSADVERIVQGCQTMHEIWASLIEVGIAIYLLERQLGVACVVPVVVSIVALLGSLLAMNSIMSRQAMWLEAIEKRISATSAMLSSMKGIKMCGLTDTLLASLQQLRVEELTISKRFRKLIIWNMVFAYLTQVFAPVLTFVIFSILASNGDRTLDTATAFTALSLFALLSEPLAALVMALATFLGGVGSFARIQKFLESEERADVRQTDMHGLRLEKRGASNDAIRIENADFGWDAEKAPLLKGINLSVPWQKFTSIVGPVGCGKSTLLLAFLGEVPTLAGSVSLGSTSIAYGSQKPWHMNVTIRQAIVGTGTFDEGWYSRVIRACALVQDFSELPDGDASEIGSGATAISGGQSQRISLARAVYARRQILILDDCFSGLDIATENHIFHELLGDRGLLREAGCTVIVVSSSAKRLPHSDYIVCLSPKGEIVEQGTFAALNDAGGYVSSFNLSSADWTSGSDDGDGVTFAERSEKSHMSPCSAKDKETGIELDYVENATCVSDSDIPVKTGPAPPSKPADESRRTGDMQIYLYYIRSVGWCATILFIIAIVGFVFCVSFPNVWVQWWAAENETHPNDRLGYWLGVYAALGGIAIVCLFLSCWQMIVNMVPKSGAQFHLSLLKTVLNAPLSFFTETDTGVTLNRFSQDLQLIDMELPVSALNTFATFVLCIAQMTLIGVGSVFAAISFPVILMALYLVQKVYLRTSRQIRLLDLEAKAPLYSLFEESLSGLATIRAFGWLHALEDKNYELLDRSQRPFYLLFAVQRWLTLVLDLIVAAVAVLLMGLVVGLRGSVSAGCVGLALLNVIQFGQSIKLLVTYWTNLETHIGSVARVRSFTENTAREDRPGETTPPPPNWPENGAIEFQNVSAAYKDDNLVLKNVSIAIKAGEKIGICGRTGSGKSSLVTTLFRALDLSYGSIRVDGVDLADLPRQEVRSRIICVPQQPFLLKGSVRFNVNPLSVSTDKAITEALQSVQLMHIVDEKGGLDADVDELKLSSGQMQLFCLARAMVRPSSILVLDEATSSIDAKTEETIQRLIRKKFASHTVVAVAHRLETIMDFDKVAVLDAGKLVEFDNPYALLEAPDSVFAKLYYTALAEDDDEDEIDVFEASESLGRSSLGEEHSSEAHAR